MVTPEIDITADEVEETDLNPNEKTGTLHKSDNPFRPPGPPVSNPLPYPGRVKKTQG